MLKLRRVEIDNFVCFEKVVIEPSTDREKPLTVLRAENGSGKTTFLRALRWGMYGERGLPGSSAPRFSLHPAWWQPNHEGIKTTVKIEFETDGSTRDAEGGPNTTVYQLARSVTTIGKPTVQSDEPDYRRINEQTNLMVKEGDGMWTPFTLGVDIVVEQLLPWGLHDFFVMDADEAADFVGGSENKMLSRQDVIDKTTAAVHSLLGIDVFREASKRLAKIAREFGAQATKAIGDTNLSAIQDELDQLREEETELTKKISDQQTQINQLEDRLRQGKNALETELKDFGAADELRPRLIENRRRNDEAIKQRREAVSLLAGELESTDLLASLANKEISGTYDMLQPLFEQGHIPLKHLYFVRELLNSGTCVCGQDLSEGGRHHRQVEDRIAESAEKKELADYLGQLHDAAKSLRSHAEENSWEDRTTQFATNLATLDKELSNLGLEKQDIDNKLDKLDEEKIQIIRDEIAAVETQLVNLRRDFALNEARLPPLTSKIDSLEKKIHQRKRNERAATDLQAAEVMSNLLVDILNRAYGTMQTEQVRELSQRMNRLFAQMAANVSDDDFDRIQHDKATLKMIAEVGLRSINDKSEEYEIFARNNRGRFMPPIEINGASRRVLALSFVLALCIESGTQAPLIADSLLNFMSGTVRRNTLRITAENSSQPILLLTGSDLEALSEAETVNQRAGATYVLTGQWDAIDAGQGGDVVNWTDQRLVSLVCQCGPRQFCDICERNGQDGTPGWTKLT